MFIRMVRATAAGTAVYCSVGYFVFELMLGEITSRHTTSLAGFRKDDDQSMLWIVLSCAAYAALVSLMLLRWQNERSVGSGFAKGALTGILVACMADSYWYGTSHFYNDLLPVALDIAAAGLTVGIMGGVVVWAGRSRN